MRTTFREHAVSALLALGGAGLWSLCFGRQPSIWLPWVALVPLVLLLGRRKAVLWGIVYAVAMWLGSMYWIAETLQSYGGLPRSLAWLAQGLLALYLGFDQVVFVFLGRLDLAPWRGSLPLWAIPALWVIIEWLRGAAFRPFPMEPGSLRLGRCRGCSATRCLGRLVRRLFSARSCQRQSGV